MLSASPLGAQVAAVSSSTPAIDFFRLEPLGGFASGSLENAGTVTDPANDEVDFTFFAEADEVLAAVVTPANSAAILTVEYVEGSGASAIASAPGAQVTLAPTNATALGLATIRVKSSLPTDFTVDIYRNTALEASVGESSATNKIDLTPSKLDVGVERFAGLGSTSLSPTQTAIYNETFQGAAGYSLNDLWHISDGRTNDSQPNHSGQALYLGQAEGAGAQLGTLHWDAELDFTANGIWESVFLNQSSTQIDFPTASNPGISGSASNLAGIKQWYTFGSAGTMDSIQDSRGDFATDNDVTWEMAFRPREFNGTHLLFETGGNGDGTALLLDGETLEFRVQDADDPTRRVVRNYTFDTVADVNKFHHIVVSVHPDPTAAENQVRLFVNGVEVGSPVSATGILSDWDGGDDFGLGNANSAFPDNDDTTITGNFDGDIAFLRYHEGRLLNTGEVAASYNNLVNDFAYVPGNYDNEQTVAGDAVSPTIALTGGTEFSLSFSSLIDIEDADEPFEQMQVLVRDTANSVEDVILDRFDGSLPVNTNGQWATIEADLSAFAGKNIQLIFRFDSVDENNNNFEGWWIDNVNVSRSNAAPTVDDDQFTVDLTGSVGQTVDIVLAGQTHADYSAQTLELLSPSGAVLATGVSDQIQSGSDATNYDLAILGHQVTAPGVYTVRVASNAATLGSEYGLLVTPGVAMETEANGLTDPLRSLGVLAAMGHLRSDSFQFYDSRAAFDSDSPGLPVEDFEGGVVDPDDVTTFVGPLTSTGNATFPSGITPGLLIWGNTPGPNDVALVGSDFFDVGEPGSKVIGADVFSLNTNLTFAPAVTAVGFDVFSDNPVVAGLYDSSGGLITTRLIGPSTTGEFFGATSSIPIDRIEIIEIGVGGGELVDNVVFGTAGVFPTPDTDSFTINLRAGQSVQLATSTPLDSGANSPLNDLNPQLEVTGPGVSAVDFDSAADGKNALLSFTATTAGDYTITVAAQSGQGEYLVRFGGDYNRNGVVDAADFTVWRDTNGQTVTPGSGADGNGDGTIDASDYLVWINNFGLSLDAAVVAATSASAYVPRQAAPAAAAVVAAEPMAAAAVSATLPDEAESVSFSDAFLDVSSEEESPAEVASLPTLVSFTPTSHSDESADDDENEDAVDDVFAGWSAELDV